MSVAEIADKILSLLPSVPTGDNPEKNLSERLTFLLNRARQLRSLSEGHHAAAFSDAWGMFQFLQKPMRPDWAFLALFATCQGKLDEAKWLLAREGDVPEPGQSTIGPLAKGTLPPTGVAAVAEGERLLVGTALAFHEGLFDEALMFVQDAIGRLSAHPQVGQLYFVAGLAAFEIDPKLSEQHLRTYLKLFPHDAKALYYLAQLLSYADRLEESLEMCRRYLIRTPDSTAILHLLASNLYFLGRYDELAREADRILRSDPQNDDLLNTFSATWLWLERYAEAEEAILAAYEITQNANLACGVGEIKLIMGQTKVAREYFLQAKTFDADESDAVVVAFFNMLSAQLLGQEVNDWDKLSDRSSWNFTPLRRWLAKQKLPAQTRAFVERLFAALGQPLDWQNPDVIAAKAE